MLIYESEGFLEVESKHIQQLCRSTVPISLGDTKREASAVYAVLCDYLDNSEHRCRIAFYSKTLKRAFVFAVKGSEKRSPWQCGQEVLVQLGFQLDDVNLRLSAAMLEVVLRDVPGLLAPAEARKQRTEKAALLAGFQNSYDEDPDTPQGKKAALKLNAEKRLNAQSEELRQSLETLFTPEEDPGGDIEALVSQVKDLTLRLETAETLAESERNQREMSESITSAAEKRIQELEEVLVDVETKSSKTLKQKQNNVQLKARIKELGEKLASAEVEVENEREKQEQFITDVKTAHEQIAHLEKGLKETAQSLENLRAQLADEQAEGTRLDECLKDAELRVKNLGEELERSEEKAARCGDVEKVAEELKAQLEEIQQTLQDTLNLNKDLEEGLATAVEERAGLEKKLQEFEKTAPDKTMVEEQTKALTEKNEQVCRELKALRDEYDQECSIRKRLEKGAGEDEKRIRELEDSLANVPKDTSEPSGDETGSVSASQEVESLKAELLEQSQRLQKEQESRFALESQLHDAHKMIDSFEKMLRETEKTSGERVSGQVSKDTENRKLQELEKKLRAVENQLEHERAEQKRLVKEVVVAEKKIADQEDLLARGQAEQREREAREPVALEPVAQKEVKAAKLLPHDLRPAPKKGALFCPDWDLEGLPCQSSKQVFKAWETVFNVQISLEGYPSQYCMAFLVVLRLKKQKKLYMLYRLKQSKHTLVCVPAKSPKDEASLKKVIKDGLNFLKMSGFEMDEMTAENIDSALKTYFLEG